MGCTQGTKNNKINNKPAILLILLSVIARMV